MTINRRSFLRGLGRSAAAAAALSGVRAGAGAAQQEGQLPGQGETGTLRDPVAAGRSRERVAASQNDEFIQGIEKRLQCTCGCTLDIYTCRTTDFTCTYSPELHKEVVALVQGGKDADAVVAAFVEKYGEKVLMAPKPEGFNIAGYVVPGLTILLVGGIMITVLRRRSLAVARRDAVPPVGASGPATPGPLPPAGAAAPASAEELARLERELRELDA